MRYILIKSIFFLLALVSVGLAQNPTKWTLELEKNTDQTIRTTRTYKAKLVAEIEEGWHLYALDQPAGGPIPTSIRPADRVPIEIIGVIRTGRPILKPDPNFLVD